MTMRDAAGEPDDPVASGSEDARVARLERRLARERAAREEAERIAERGMRELWQANRELESRVADRTTELRRALAAATMAKEAKEQFLAELGHELTTPLHAILGTLELADATTLDDTNRERLSTVREHSHRLAALLHGLIELAGAEGAPAEEDFTERRPGNWLDDAVVTWTKPAAIRGQLLVPSNAGGGGAVMTADWTRLRRMLAAVMSNVTLHAGPGAVGLTLVVSDAEISLSVSDSGPGIDDDALATVLEPFVSYGTERGVGVGLSIVDRLARAAGGRIELSSDGDGTTVAMTLPRP